MIQLNKVEQSNRNMFIHWSCLHTHCLGTWCEVDYMVSEMKEGLRPWKNPRKGSENLGMVLTTFFKPVSTSCLCLGRPLQLSWTITIQWHWLLWWWSGFMRLIIKDLICSSLPSTLDSHTDQIYPQMVPSHHVTPAYVILAWEGGTMWDCSLIKFSLQQLGLCY